MIAWLEETLLVVDFIQDLVQEPLEPRGVVRSPHALPSSFVLVWFMFAFSQRCDIDQWLLIGIDQLR